MGMAIGILVLHLYLPGCSSLKEKRARLKPLLHRLHREFKLSVSEMDHQDTWQSALVGCAAIQSAEKGIHPLFSQVENWVEENWPDVQIQNSQVEIIR